MTAEDDVSLSKLDDKLNIAINRRHKMALIMIARSMQISLSDMARIALNEYVTRRYPDYDNLLNSEAFQKNMTPKKEVVENARS